MVAVDRSFSPREVGRLKEIRGQVLLAVGYVPVSGNMAFGRVRLYLSGHDVDVTVSMQGVDYTGDGMLDDDAFLAVEESQGSLTELSEIAGEEERVPFGKVVRRVLVAQDEATVRAGDETALRVSYPQAVVLDVGDEFLSIDKQNGPWAMVYVKRGSVLTELVFDDSGSWEEDSQERPGEKTSYAQTLTEV